MRSVIFSLFDPVKCCVLNRNLPNNGIRFGDRETLNPTSFPGWPSFGDLLCNGGSKTFVGLTFHIHPNSRAIARQISEKLSPSIAELKQFDDTADLGIYENYPRSSWLEIKWSTIPPSRMIDIQTNDVLWYPSANPTDKQVPIAFGIEHLEYLTKEADYDLIVPKEFPFPLMTIEFLND